MKRTWMKLNTIAFAVISLLLVASPVSAQVATGSILGNVTDASGATVPGATVTATNVDTQFSRSTTTDESGQYALRLLPLGNYKLEVALSGFKNFSQTGIVLEVGRNARIDASIEPGNVAESVSVVADAPLVETSSSSLARTVGQNEVLNLPLVNRDLYSLLSLTGGVTSNENSNSLGGPEQLTLLAAIVVEPRGGQAVEHRLRESPDLALVRRVVAEAVREVVHGLRPHVLEQLALAQQPLEEGALAQAGLGHLDGIEAALVERGGQHDRPAEDHVRAVVLDALHLIALRRRP